MPSYYPSKPTTHIRKTPYPWSWVWVSAGTGVGCPKKPQGYPRQSLFPAPYITSTKHPCIIFGDLPSKISIYMLLFYDSPLFWGDEGVANSKGAGQDQACLEAYYFQFISFYLFWSCQCPDLFCILHLFWHHLD